LRPQPDATESTHDPSRRRAAAWFRKYEMARLHSFRAAGPDQRLANEVSRLLAMGGDDRIEVSPQTGLNAYGCAPAAWTGGPTFSSTTASPILPEGVAAACQLLAMVQARTAGEDACEVAAVAIRRRLRTLCELPQDAEIILSPSGTDVHRLAAAFARGDDRRAFTTVTPDPLESGRRVESALRAAADGLSPGRLLSAPLRSDDGVPLTAFEIDARCAEACERALRADGRALLVLFDVSKTGLRAPSAACAAELKARHRDRLTVLVDACQFRLSAAALRAYLDLDFLVAVTGSKFLAGPAFSGALIAPPRSAAIARQAPLPWRALAGATRQDWPETFAGRALLPRSDGLGLAVRWAAALAELERLRAAPTLDPRPDIARFAAAFEDRLSRSDVLTPVAAAAQPAPGPCPSADPRTIFAFTLRRGGAG
jgi:hypothetical protein